MFECNQLKINKSLAEIGVDKLLEQTYSVRRRIALHFPPIVGKRIVTRFERYSDIDLHDYLTTIEERKEQFINRS